MFRPKIEKNKSEEKKIESISKFKTSLDQLSFPELCQKVWDESIENQEILNEAALRYKNNQIKDWALRNLLATMKDKDTLIFPVQLKDDSLKMRKYFFEQLRSRIGVGGSFYWSGSPEAYNRDFISLAQDIIKINMSDMTKLIHLQDRAINSLGNLLISNDEAGDRVRDIANSFLTIKVIKTASEPQEQQENIVEKSITTTLSPL